MNVYILKEGNKAWELATGNNKEEAAEALQKYFHYTSFDPNELELYSEKKGEERSYHYGYVDPRNGNIFYPDPGEFFKVYGFDHPVILAEEEEDYRSDEFI